MKAQRAGRPSGNPDVIRRAEAVAEVLAANRQRIEMDREVPEDVMQELHKARLFRLLLPRDLGGDEVDFTTLARVTEIVAAADASAAWCIGQGGGCAMSAAFLQPEAARRFFGSDNAVLAWGAGAQGQAYETEGGGYRVSGKWSFASGSRRATALGAHCKAFAADGSPRLRADGRQVEVTALFPRDKARIHDDWQVMGLKGTGSDTYEVRDLVVMGADVFDREDLKTSARHGILFTFPSMMAYESAFSGVMLGLARGMLDDLLELATTKTPRGASMSLRDSPLFRTEIATLEARFRSARLYLHDTFENVWDAVAHGSPLTLEHRIDARLAATHCINEAAGIVVDAYRAAGSSAVFENNPFEHRLRDALSASQQVQGRTAHYATVGCHLLGLPPDSMMFL